MKISILCNDGSPLNVTVKSVYGEDGRSGVGGAELSILTLAEAWHKAGHEVVLYNNASQGSPFEHRNISDFEPQADRDVLVNFRSPNLKTIGARGKKVWFSCDQYTIGDYREFSKHVDEIIVISDFHAKYFADMYGIQKSTVIDLPVRSWDYDDVGKVEKVRGQCLFSSVPDRGLPILASLWPRIVEQVPYASLVITSGWSLWTGQSDAQWIAPYRMMFGSSKNVNYLGAVNRRELVKHQLQSDLFLFPNIYDELFCIACSEAQWAGAWPVTSTTGALRTTTMGTTIDGNPNDLEWQAQFVKSVVEKLQADNLPILQNFISAKAHERFNTERILKEWNKVLQ